MGICIGYHDGAKIARTVSCLLGIGQVARQLESERLAYTFMLNEFRATANKRMLRKLKKFPIDKGGEVSNTYLGVRSEGMMKLGIGVMRNMTSMLDCVMIVLRYKGYTLKEKIHFPLGGIFSLSCLWDAVMQSDFGKVVPQLEVPVYVLHGKFDYQVSYSIAKEFVENIKAPIKGFYTFENSAHSPCFEEAEKMCHILCEDVLQNKNNLADK